MDIEIHRMFGRPEDDRQVRASLLLDTNLLRPQVDCVVKRILSLALLLGALIGLFGQAAAVASPHMPVATAASPSPLDDCAHMMAPRSEEHTSALQSLMRNSYAVFCLQKKNTSTRQA